MEPGSLHDMMKLVADSSCTKDRFGELEINITDATFKQDEDASKTEVRVPFEVTPAVCNHHGTLHGGVSAWLIDTITSVHHLTACGNIGGASIALSVKYYRPVRAGVKAVLVSRIGKVGRRVSFINAVILQNDKVCVEGVHTHAPFWADSSKL